MYETEMNSTRFLTINKVIITVLMIRFYFTGFSLLKDYRVLVQRRSS